MKTRCREKVTDRQQTIIIKRVVSADICRSICTGRSEEEEGKSVSSSLVRNCSGMLVAVVKVKSAVSVLRFPCKNPAGYTFWCTSGYRIRFDGMHTFTPFACNGKFRHNSVPQGTCLGPLLFPYALKLMHLLRFFSRPWILRVSRALLLVRRIHLIILVVTGNSSRGSSMGFKIRPTSIPAAAMGIFEEQPINGHNLTQSENRREAFWRRLRNRKTGLGDNQTRKQFNAVIAACLRGRSNWNLNTKTSGRCFRAREFGFSASQGFRKRLRNFSETSGMPKVSAVSCDLETQFA